MRFGWLDVSWLAGWLQLWGDSGSLVGGRRQQTVGRSLFVVIHVAADPSCSTCGEVSGFQIIERDFPGQGGLRISKNRATLSRGWSIWKLIFGDPYRTLGQPR